jgi:putative spermidine/putrescine transport system ATP-binding protein
MNISLDFFRWRALARALASGSDLLLLDEPLSALDARVRVDLRYELRRLTKALGLTTIHVTHDQEEAMTVSDQIVLMRAGAIVKAGTPEGLVSVRPEFVYLLTTGPRSKVTGSINMGAYGASRRPKGALMK